MEYFDLLVVLFNKIMNNSTHILFKPEYTQHLRLLNSKRQGFGLRDILIKDLLDLQKKSDVEDNPFKCKLFVKKY